MTVTDTCQWFALCENPADGLAAHFVLTAVPCCQRCADRFGMTLQPIVTTTPERARREALEAGLDEHQAAEVEALVADACDELGCS